MNKYYKVDDVSRAIIELPNAENCYSGSYDKAEILNALEDLPTIEVSVEELRKKYKDFYEQGKFDALLEVSEDCISREWVKGICEMMLDEEMLEHMLGYIEDAPSVVPKQVTGKLESVEISTSEEEESTMSQLKSKLVPTTEQSCDTCRHNKLEWFSEECDGCTKANSSYEPTTEQSSMVGEWVNEKGIPIPDQHAVYCSLCKSWSEYRDNFCGNCGARMRG